MSEAVLLPVEEIKALSQEFQTASPGQGLQCAAHACGTRIAFGTSFQGAGLVAIHHAVSLGLSIPVFTIDTGLLFPETLDLKLRLEQFFGIEIETLIPEQTVSEQGGEFGPALWDKNPDLSCTLRKVFPLHKNLSTLAASLPCLPT